MQRFDYIYFRFKCEIPNNACRERHNFLTGSFSNHVWKIEFIGERWNETRYRIEKKIGFHDERQKKSSNHYSYIEAVPWSQFCDNPNTTTFIQSDDHIAKGSQLVIWRKPLPIGFKPFVPIKYRREYAVPKALDEYTEATDKLNDEDEKIRILQSQSHTQSVSNTDLHHTELLKMYSGPPPRDYCCHRCGARGHHYNYVCPTKDDPNWIPLNKRRVLKGIPKKWLRPARPDELGIACKTIYDELVMFKDEYKQYQ